VKSGEDKGTQYEINSKLIHQTDSKGKSQPKKIEKYDLEKSIYKDIKNYPNSSIERNL
jgi:hypothetical protein